MSTFINSGIISLTKRFSEIDLILKTAADNFEKNESLYSALCRSAQVLLSAHFEGYLKDLIKNALEDINSCSSFKDSNTDLKNSMCQYLISPSKEEKNTKNNKLKVDELIEIFEGLETKFKSEYFSKCDYRNPKVTVLNEIAERFGVKNFFNKLKKSNLDLVFSNTNADNIKLKETIRSHLFSSTENYPYSIDLSILEIDENKLEKDNLWDVFLSELLKRRHDIAHGKEIENSVGHALIESDKTKIEILIYAFTMFIGEKANPIKK